MIVVQVEPPSVDLSILYPVIAEPPSFEGAVHDRLTCDDNTAVAASPVGAPGAVTGIGLGVIVIDDVTVSVFVEEYVVYKVPPLNLALILYDPAVLGAVNPLTRYFPLESVVVFGMVIGEVAVNVIVLEARGFPIVVSVRVPEKLYVPPGDTDDDEISRVIELLSF